MTRPIGRAFTALLLLSIGGPARAQTEVYATDFNDGVDAHWSHDDTFNFPRAKETCLGRFTNDQVTLKLTDLPDHAFIRVEFDLILIRTWDGNKPKIGPDRWSFKTDDGRAWVDHTFANTNSNEDALATQSFPSTLAGEQSPPTTGAIAVNNIGGLDLDSTYRMQFTIPHRKNAITLLFRGHGLQDVNNECWCLNNVRVTVLQAEDIPAAGDKTLAALIGQLREEKPAVAWQAMLDAVAQGDRFTDYVESNLKDEIRLGSNRSKQEQVDRWIEQLDSDSYAKREAATQRLAANLTVARPAIEARLEDNQVTPEQRWRLKRVLTSHEAPPIADPDDRLELRLIRTLKLIGTDKAIKLTKQIAGDIEPAP